MKIKIISNFVILLILLSQGFIVNGQDEVQIENLLFKKSSPANASNGLVNSTTLKMQSSGYATDGVTRYTFWNLFSKGVSTWGSGHLVFQSNTDGSGFKEQVRFTNNGRVGIGGINPSRKLEIKDGSILIKSDPYADIKIERGNNSYLTMGVSSNSHEAFLSTSESFKVLTEGSGTPKFMIHKDGSVGVDIGKITPQAKLHVNGNILAAEVTVSTAATEVPDYVFKDEYKLTSLTDLEKYIKENHHLPEIPSAAEVEAEGLDLAKMNLLLLKKIEELTLHTIEQEKQIDKQETQISELTDLVLELYQNQTSNE